ncbi:nucleoside-diphosphate sugar epimerase/dehydratase [Guyparkeria sp. SCN-R1]|uniref:polysaccharide biosynthesis protein n=1 Tax=Guyparkeria sp. SCN-R1 TaxID=2341113 RepID=UPI00195E0742|nr:nucleoside-diphosphate sugar epimerase/dehydratase [Guyparkeria sp. SCN-R1]
MTSIARFKELLRELPSIYKRGLMVALDLFLIPFALWAALSLRYGELFTDFNRAALAFVGLVAFTILVFVRLGLYRAVMRFLGWKAFEQIAMGVAGSTLVLLAILLLHPQAELPRSTFVIYGLLLFVLVGGSRFLARRVLGAVPGSKGRERVAIYGAGASGQQVVGMLSKGTDYEPVVFLDDAEDLHGREIDGLRVVDPKKPGLTLLLERLGVQSILLSVPSADAATRRSILNFLEPLPFHVRTVPGIEDILSGKATLDQVREVDIEDLLGREPVPPRPELLGKCIVGKTVLVTGAGGSIGSELCRQVVDQGAARLILFELSEFGLYQIDQELRRIPAVANGPVELIAALGSVLGERRLARLFDRFTVDTVYHAAAYKHVPLVEHNPIEGLSNNALGTLSVARVAANAGVTNFVLISTDKAVRPTNVMGASKRLAEMALQALQPEYPDTTFCMVRFGNVLGSSGSVVPLFRRQIAGGGPVTVTHQEITRYFMTIPEAVQLVIQAGSMGEGGDVFVLDMGEPVKIAHLARRMIHLSGLEVRDEENPDGDIEITYTGLRPGEKLYEELLIGEAVNGTEHPRIMRASEDCLTWRTFDKAISRLQRDMERSDLPAVRAQLAELVSGYQAHARIEDHCWKE